MTNRYAVYFNRSIPGVADVPICITKPLSREGAEEIQKQKQKDETEPDVTYVVREKFVRRQYA